MQSNTVVIDRSVHPNKIIFSDQFNVAIPFIDRHLSEGRADKLCIITEKISWTYSDLATSVGKYANQLLAMDMVPGQRLLMAVTDGPEFIALFFGAIKAGVVPIAVNTMLRTSDYKFLIDDCKCTSTIWSNSVDSAMRPAISSSSHKPKTTSTLEDFINDSKTANSFIEPATTNSMSECFWLYSSGSTGNPKGVVHPHRSMVCTSERFGKTTAGLLEDDIVFSVSKLFHSYGFGNAMTFPLWVGATIILSDDRVTPEMSFKLIEKFKPTVFFGVPTLYGQQLQEMETSKPDLSSLRICISAGEALPNNIFRRWKEQTGTIILDGLGSTENLHIFISNRPDNLRSGTSGLPVEGYEVKLVNDQGNEIKEVNEIGTVWVKGESSAKLYWNNPDKTAETMRGEWLNTGDMYYRDAQGFYHNAGRSDDMMKVGGLWCSPFEIENRLIEHPIVLEAAVVAKIDGDGLTKPAAFIVIDPDKEPSEEIQQKLVEHCREALAHYKYPRWFYFVQELPKTVTGKIQRFRLRDQAKNLG